MEKITQTQSGASAVSRKKIQKFIGEVRDRIDEKDLEQAGHFCHTDFALELRADKLLLFTVRGWSQ